MPGLGSATKVHVKAALLPNTGADPLSGPVAAGERDVVVANGTAALQVQSAAHDGLLLTLTPALAATATLRTWGRKPAYSIDFDPKFGRGGAQLLTELLENRVDVVGLLLER